MAFVLKDRLKGTLRSLVEAPLARGHRCAKVMAIASGKGGVGKTTTAVNLALAYAERGHHTLLLDLDPQAHVAESLQVRAPQGASSLGDVFLGRMRDVVEVTWPTRWPHLSLAGSDKRLGEVEPLLAAKIGRELLLTQGLQVARSHFDLVVIDCPPNLGTLTINALCAADKLLVPTDPSQLALAGVEDVLSALSMLQTILNRPTELLGIVTTRQDRRLTEINRRMQQSFEDLWGDKLLRTVIPQASAINRAHMTGRPVSELAPRSPGAKAYRALADELAPHLGLLQAATFLGKRPQAR